MKTKYKFNNKEMIVNIYDTKILTKEEKIKKWMFIINNLILKNNLKFKGKRILIYENNIYMGYFSLTLFFLKKLYLGKHIANINENNCYFEPAFLLEIKPRSKKIVEKEIILLN